MSTETTVGRLPFLQAKNTAPSLQLLWYPVAVRVVSLFLESVFASSYLFLCVCIYFCLACKLVMCAWSQSQCVFAMLC